MNTKNWSIKRFVFLKASLEIISTDDWLTFDKFSARSVKTQKKPRRVFHKPSITICVGGILIWNREGIILQSFSESPFVWGIHQSSETCWVF
jgi:hypothetical protein